MLMTLAFLGVPGVTWAKAWPLIGLLRIWLGDVGKGPGH